MKVDLNINEEVMDNILEMANELVGSRTFFIGILDEVFSVRKVFSQENGSKLAEGLTLPLALSVCNLVTCDESLVIENTIKDARTRHLEAIYRTNIGSYLGTPIVLEDGQLFGTLCAVDPDPYEFSQREIKAMQRLANILSTLIYKHQVKIVPEVQEKMLKLDKLALVGQLAAGLAHEIRNPMQSVKGFIQLLFDENEKSAPFKDIVLSELDRINELVSDFLLITQPSAPKKERISITELITSTVELLRSEANLHNIDMFLEEGESVPHLDVDPAQMRQVFINLVKNAIEAIKENGTINISVQNNEEFVVIRIKDTGPGIPLAIINKVGNPFFSTKENGIGLGLSICKTIIKEHQGNLHIENYEDGTLIHIHLPLPSR